MHTVPVVYQKYVGRLVTLAGVIGFLVLSAPPSVAAPPDTGTATDTLTVSLGDLGSAPNLEFWGLTSTQVLTVPVLRGLTPNAMNATVELPINLRSGTLTVSQDQRTLTRINLPTADQTPIVIPLAGAEVVDNWLTVTLRSYLLPQDGVCLYPESPLRLSSPSISYTGIEQPPTTVAHFLPPVLKKLSIFLPQSPSASESDTAIQLAASAASRYGRQNPEIAVVPLTEGQLAPPTPPQPLERQIVVKEGSDNGLALQGSGAATWLLMSGPLGENDESDTAVLFSDLSQLAVSSKAVVDQLKPNLQQPGNTTTLRDLGQPVANATSLQPRVSLALDQTRFGRSIRGVRVHLQGSYTPTPSNIGGQIAVTVGPETIDHFPTDGHGTIDRWVDVPDRLLQRYTSLDLVLDVASNVGHCGDFYTAGPGNQLLNLNVNGDTTVESSPAAPPVPESMPQALMPRFQVGIEAHSLPDTVRAINLVVGLQRISSTPIYTHVTSVQQAIDSSNPAILIAADGWSHSNVVLPVSAGPSGPITVNANTSDGKPTTLALDPVMKFASLQTVFNHGRSLLVATSNGTSAQLDELIRWLGGDNNKRWQRLKGVAVVAVAGQDPVTVDHSPTAGPVAAPHDHSDLGWLWWLGGGWLAVTIVGAGVIVLRSRR
ncbi:hypothetical protein [Mycobacterium montefiorense]|uniref:Cellulose synthase n=1 Tax=Mycobacterium montefiorense TaxID=154654 RepID=A0AA37PKR7_9MYCO|nr:hypothetical protein [Mycobacterium montefiorense]GBG40083.1 hypothetical protein MmonteBS_44550 [Mycobacterium montefiorense]GKU33556.1 hypothetical protein NJB14191_09030 [Mycobacterium montefiorense]GKU39494.1 hypothetical protein NJB14192_14870 [Mycobacterium montefiorense]GKU43771.1 hypothetical protein NJB14194_04040 [Mycobacterium montefiorense]GKU52737.1 hypothetical protein NJB14195_39790 [Mycobacterium montefiorense]